MSEVSCDVFQGRLDRLLSGKLSEVAERECRLHAQTCQGCAVLLRLRTHLEYQSQDELEVLVPDDWVEDMWWKVESEIGPREDMGRRIVRRGRLSGGLIPTLAAACLLLLASTGYLYLEVGSLREREVRLAQRIDEQRGWLAELEQRTRRVSAEVRTARLAASESWERMLARRRSVSPADLSAILADLPQEATILRRADVKRLTAGLASRPSVWRESLSEVQVEDGIQAEELQLVLDRLRLAPRRRIPTARILALYGSAVGGGT